MPLYAFWLPLYSFWHFDDFTWGSTRNVHLDDFDQATLKDSEEVFDPSMVPVKPWSEYVEQDLGWRRTFEGEAQR